MIGGGLRVFLFGSGMKVICDPFTENFPCTFVEERAWTNWRLRFLVLPIILERCNEAAFRSERDVGTLELEPVPNPSWRAHVLLLEADIGERCSDKNPVGAHRSSYGSGMKSATVSARRRSFIRY